jgi:hypothetical protein
MKTTFTTTDLGLAALILCTRNMRLLTIERIPDPNRNLANITFDDPESVGDDLEAVYFAGDGVVAPLPFYSQLRHLKRKVYLACSSPGAR